MRKSSSKQRAAAVAAAQPEVEMEDVEKQPELELEQELELLPPPQRIPHARVQQLRAAAALPPAPPRIVRRTFTLDHPLGDVVVTVKGPAGAAKLQSSHTSLSISTEGELPALSSTRVERPVRAAAPPRPLSGDPEEPGGTIEESLPGEDAGDAAKALQPGALAFLRGAEKDLLRRSSQE